MDVSRLSPKKQCQRNSILIGKGTNHRKTLSPKNNAKIPTNNKSPNGKKYVQIGMPPHAESSQAIQTAKKLKQLINTGNQKKQIQPIKEEQKQSKSIVKRNRKSKQSPPSDTSSDESPTKCTFDAPAADVDGFMSFNSSEADIKTEISSDILLSWSRDEDKIVLEHIKMGFTSEESLIVTLQTEQLSNRSYNEIYDRFKFLMDIISKL